MIPNGNRGKMLFKLFWTFTKMSPVTFGGGYAMIPLIERETVQRRRWLKPNDMADVFSLAGTAPGAIGVNAAVLIGYRIAGVAGSLASLAGMLLPTFCIIILLSALIFHMNDNPWAQAAFKGMTPAVVALIFYAGCRIGKSAVTDKTTMGMAAISFFVLWFVRIPPIWVVLAAIAAGLLLKVGRSLMNRKRKKNIRQGDPSPHKRYPEQYREQYRADSMRP